MNILPNLERDPSHKGEIRRNKKRRVMGALFGDKEVYSTMEERGVVGSGVGMEVGNENIHQGVGGGGGSSRAITSVGGGGHGGDDAAFMQQEGGAHGVSGGGSCNRGESSQNITNGLSRKRLLDASQPFKEKVENVLRKREVVGPCFSETESDDDLGLDEDDEDDDSEDAWSSSAALEDFLPIKRGFSKYYAGKSKSFPNISEVTDVSQLAKSEHPYNKKRRILLGIKYHSEADLQTMMSAWKDFDDNDEKGKEQKIAKE